MEPGLQRRVQRYGWDKAAHYYESSWQEQLRPAQDLMMQLASLQRGEIVLDLACGTGLVSFKAKDAVGEEGFVLGTDISDKMIETANQTAQRRKIERLEFSRMEAEELKLDEAKFDVTLCALGLMYVPDPIHALKEMHRVLKPGGRAALAVWGKRDHCGWAEIFEIVDKRVASEVCPMFFHLGNPGILALSLKNASFSRVVTQIISTKLVYSSDEEACEAAFAGGPVALAYNKFSEQVKKEAEAEYLDSLAPYRSANGYEIPGEFVVAIGYKD
ncbi:MAG: dimethylmenaquinone methyltransferase [Bacteroidetes bacterium]|nr:MAG: dimethylmenaquinone methyltransferase [Bacteroidota bacterium]